MKYLIVLTGIFFHLISLGQITRYKFTIRYEDNNPHKYGIIIINRQEVSTDGNGHGEVNIQNSEATAIVASPNTNIFKIKYPVNFVVNLPKNPSVAIDILLEKAKKIEKPVTPADIARLQKAQEQYLKSKDAQLVKSFEEYNRRLYDSISVLLKTRTFNKEKIIAGRMEFLPQISKTLDHYLNEAKDFKDAFSVMAISLNNKQAYDQLAAATYSYNEIFELINANKSTYEQAISSYWDSKELALKFSNLTEYALEEIHKPYILEINDAFIARLYGCANEKNRKRKKELEAEIAGDIQKHSQSLSKRLGSLGERIAAFLAILKNVNI